MALANANSATTTFTMPAKAVTVTAGYKTATGVDAPETPLARIYPNPTDGAVIIETMGHAPLSEEYVVSISDMSGRILLRQTVTDQTVRLDMSSFAAGAYLLTIDDSKRQTVTKILKN